MQKHVPIVNLDYLNPRIALAETAAKFGFNTLITGYLKPMRTLIAECNDELIEARYSQLSARLSEATDVNPDTLSRDDARAFFDAYYSFIRDAAKLCQITTRRNLNDITLRQFEILKAHQRIFNPITLTTSGRVSPILEHEAETELRQAGEGIKCYTGERMEYLYCRMVNDYVQNAGNNLIEAIDNGLPIETATSYWRAMKPTVSISDEDENRAYSLIMGKYRELAKSVQKHIADCELVDSTSDQQAMKTAHFILKRIEAMNEEIILSIQCSEYEALTSMRRKLAAFIPENYADSNSVLLKALTDRIDAQLEKF